MNKLKLLAGALLVILAVSVSANAYFGSQYFNLTNQKNESDRQNEMMTLLSQVQVKVDNELRRLGTSLVYASQQLSNTGLSGDQARAVIRDLAANSSFTIEAATQNLNHTMITVEPPAHYDSEGKTLGPQKWLNPNPVGAITPCMTDVLPLIVGFKGISIVAPIFDANKTVMVGTVSIAFDHVQLLNACITQALAGASYEMWVAQKSDGQVIFDQDATHEGTFLLSDPLYTQNPQTQAIMQQILQQPSGHGTYVFAVGQDASQTASRECFWATASAYGGEWRLVIFH